MKKLSAIWIILVFAVSFATAEDDLTPGFTDILNLTTPGSPVISPDGTKIVYTVSSTDWEKNRYVSQIYMIDVSTGESRQLTYADSSSGNPEWSPDGSFISFTSSRGEESKTQVYILPLAGGEARKITSSKTGVQGYAWSPDGTRIAFSDYDEQDEAEKEREEKYGSFEFIEEELDHARLRIINIKDGEIKTLVERDDLNVGGFNWRNDGKSIVFNATPDNRIKSWSDSDIYIVEVESGEISDIVKQTGPDSSPQWSPDGKYIAFSSKLGAEAYYKNSEIVVLNVESRQTTVITEDFDENPGSSFWTDQGLMFTARQGMKSCLFRVNPDNSIVRISDDSIAQVSGVSFSDNAEQMAFVAYGANDFPEIYTSSTTNYKPQKLSNFAEQVANWQLAQKEPVSWKSTDGTEITGVLIKPADFDPAKKYPLFVVIHGGPSSISVPLFYDWSGRTYPIEQWVAKGAVVLEPNYRGSTGFGEAFRSLNYRNLGVGDYWDVISGVDHLIAQGFVDPEKVCAMGWSQGGYISAFITTFSDRFLAVSVGAGISDWVDYYYRTDITPFTIHYLGETPWADPDVYAKTSPMTYINKAQTPTLIQHGSNDARVPINNAYKLYRGLTDVGVPVRFVVYKGFGHGINRPKERLAVLTHNWKWFNKYVWGEDSNSGEAMEGEKEK